MLRVEDNKPWFINDEKETKYQNQWFYYYNSYIDSITGYQDTG